MSSIFAKRGKGKNAKGVDYKVHNVGIITLKDIFEIAKLERAIDV